MPELEDFDALIALLRRPLYLQHPQWSRASMWTKNKAETIQIKAGEVNPDIVTSAIPRGLQFNRGPGAIVRHLCERILIVLYMMISKAHSGSMKKSIPSSGDIFRRIVSWAANTYWGTAQEALAKIGQEIVCLWGGTISLD